jgi:5-formyltetrahydrofolate cyclo-ligase
MDKAALRKQYKAIRAQLSDQEIEDLSLAIANRALTLNIWQQQYYHLFLPIVKKREVNTEYLLHILQGKDKSIVLSKSDFNTQTLTHFLLQDHTELSANRFGIVEPKDGIQIMPTQLQVVFIPLLAYDKAGNRLGYGKGFYDRFLAECPKNVIKVGLSFFEPETAIATQAHDIDLDYCVTPTHVFAF